MPLNLGLRRTAPISLLEETLFALRLNNVFAFFAHLSPEAIYTLARTNHNLSNFVAVYSREAWDVDRFLSTFFLDPLEFRHFLSACSAAICGQQALAFFDRENLPFHDFDIIVKFGGLLEMGQFIVSEGFQYAPAPGDHFTFDFTAYMASTQLEKRDLANAKRPTNLLRYFNFFKVRPEDSQTLNIRLHLVNVDPIQYVTSFQSSRHCFFLHMMSTLLTSSC